MKMHHDSPFSMRGGLVALLIALSLPAQALESSDWHAWRGPHANGSISASKNPVAPGPASIAWKLELPGKGGSSPIVSGNSIYLTSPAEGMDSIMAVSLDGKQKWITKLTQESPPRHRTLGSSCNSSPVTDGKSIFAYFRSGTLASVGTDGSLQWKKDLNTEFGAEQLYWDQGSSPILTADHLILTRLHQGESWIAAFDKKTGALKWKQSRNFKVPSENDNGYATPLLIEHEKSHAILVWGADHLTAHDPATGKLIWSAGGFNPAGTGNWPAISTPVISGNLAIVPVGRDDRPRQASLHAVRLGGNGDVSSSHVAWKRDDVGVFVTALAEYNGHVYLLRHRGEIACIHPTTGNTVWSDALPKDRAPFYASPVIANGVMYAAREDGVLFKVKVGEKFELLGETPLGERVVASPAPTGSQLLVRGDKHLFCLK